MRNLQVESGHRIGDPEVNQLLFGPITAEAGEAGEAEEEVSLKGMKEFASRLPLESSLRKLILREPDSMPRAKALAKMEVFAQLLSLELDLQW